MNPFRKSGEINKVINIIKQQPLDTTLFDMSPHLSLLSKRLEPLDDHHARVINLSITSYLHVQD